MHLDMHAFRYPWHATFPIPTYVQTHITCMGIYIYVNIYMCVCIGKAACHTYFQEVF